MKNILIIFMVLFLISCDQDNKSSSITDNSNPKTSTEIDQVVAVGSIVNLEINNSRNQDDTELSYEWYFISIPENSNVIIIDPTTATATFTPDIVGTYTIALELNDGVDDGPRNTVTIEAVHYNNAPPNSYAPGTIIVIFYDHVIEQDADNLVNSYGLTWTSSFPQQFSYWVKVLAGSATDYMEQLSNNEIVYWAKERGYSQGDPNFSYILVLFNETATQESAQNLIDSFDNLEVADINVGAKAGAINVNDGTEQYWISVFKNNMDLVEHAQLNYIITVNKD